MGTTNIKSEEDYVKVLQKAQKELAGIDKRVKDVRSSAKALLKALDEGAPDSATGAQRESYDATVAAIRDYLQRHFPRELLDVDDMLEDCERVLEHSGRL